MEIFQSFHIPNQLLNVMVFFLPLHCIVISGPYCCLTFILTVMLHFCYQKLNIIRFS